MIDITRAAHEAETVRKARPDELGRLAAVLARAFYDDPPIRWVITDDGRRRKLLCKAAVTVAGHDPLRLSIRTAGLD